MNQKGAEQFIKDLYTGILGREPGAKELGEWTSAALSREPEKIVRAFLSSTEYQAKVKNAVSAFFSNGHYYSPVVNPAGVGEYVADHQKDEIAGIKISIARMLEFWSKNADFIRETPFEDERNERHRFHYNNRNFSYGDAILLRAMIRHHKPRQIVEVGSGFSSACILDSAEQAGLTALQLTCIDPEADRLRGVLRPSDQVTILEQPIQQVSLDVFRRLERGDILFIDSTHVLKTGSDVHYELFCVLPALQDGVLIHFHDIHYPFEYPDEWIFQLNYSWNEIYALRAFLMYNTRFKIEFWNGFFAYHCRDHIDAVSKVFLKNPGGSIWIRKVAETRLMGQSAHGEAPP